jgi:hypothetical protein
MISLGARAGRVERAVKAAMAPRASLLMAALISVTLRFISKAGMAELGAKAKQEDKAEMAPQRLKPLALLTARAVSF